MSTIWVKCRNPHQGHWVEAEDTHGLAVTPAIEADSYTCELSDTQCIVTHIRSGQRVGNAYARADAEKLLRRLLGLTDWTLPMDELPQGRRTYFADCVQAAILEIESGIIGVVV